MLITGRSQAGYFFELAAEVALVKKSGAESCHRKGLACSQQLFGFLNAKLLLVKMRRQANRFFKNPQQVIRTEMSDVCQRLQGDGVCKLCLHIVKNAGNGQWFCSGRRMGNFCLAIALNKGGQPAKQRRFFLQGINSGIGQAGVQRSQRSGQGTFPDAAG